MLHTFKPGTIDAAKCVHCKHTADMHDCDICGRDVSVQLKYGNMLMCAECSDNEEKLFIESQKPENIAARVSAVNEKVTQAASVNDIIRQSQVTDDGIQVRTDLFNAATTAIVDLKAAIDSDEAITNKPFALAEELKRRHEHFRDVIFEMNEKIVAAGNEQKAIQVYLNQLANTLHAEEREKLKIADLNYQPKVVKVSTPRAIKTTGTKKTKLDKNELRKWCLQLTQELGSPVPEFMLQTVVVSKGVSVEDAAKLLKQSILNARTAKA